MKIRQNGCRGTGLIEFTLIVIPVLFLLVLIFEIARGMWIYHTVAYAVQQGTRYGIVHGELCASSSQSCLISVATLAQVINRSAAGLDPSRFRVTLKSRNGSLSCDPLNTCFSNTTAWPPTSGSHPGFALSVSAIYPFQTAMTIALPGSATAQPINLSATAREEIRF